MNDKILIKRNKLKELSLKAKEKAEKTEHELSTVNEQIMRFIYNPLGVLEFRSFKKWKENGYTVKKGSKAFLLWGQPLNKNAEGKEDLYNFDDADNIELFFPIAFVFSSNQVRKIDPKKNNNEKV